MKQAAGKMLRGIETGMRIYACECIKIKQGFWAGEGGRDKDGREL